MTDALDTIARLLAHARTLGADASDALMVETTDMSVSHRLGRPEGLERSESKGLGLRVFIGRQQAMASTTDTTEPALAELAERAVAMARAIPEDAYGSLAPESLLARACPDLDLCDAAEPEMDWLAAQARIAEDTARAQPGITNSEGADAYYGLNRLSLGIHSGAGLTFADSYRTSHFSLSVSVLAGTGTGMERDYDFTSARHRADLAGPERIGMEAARRALRRLHPRRVATARVPVVFDPRVSRSLMSVLAGAISGTAIARGSSFLKDSLGTALFSDSVTIIDDPHRRAGLGSRPFDGEGVANARRTIVDKGVLTSWLLDMRSASKLGLSTTGHAARGTASPPSPAPTNFYMENGCLSPEALMRDIRSGFYVTDTFGMGINSVTGDYSQGAAGFWIENGALAYPVSEVTIAGNLRDMYRDLTPADDLAFRYATNAPTLRVETMTVAGT